MPSQAATTVASALAAVAANPAPLPTAALTALADHAMADPAWRAPLRVALLGRTDVPADLATRIAAGTPDVPTPSGVQVAYLLRPEHTEADLRRALGDRGGRQAVLRALATSQQASTTLLEVLADFDDVAPDVLVHPHTSPDARVTALARLDDMANEGDMRDRRHDRYGQFAGAIRRGVTPPLAEEAAAILTNPVLLASVASNQALSETAHHRVIDVCLRTNPARTDNLVEMVVTALGTYGSAAVRQAAADVLIALGIRKVVKRSTLMTLGLASPPRVHVAPLTEQRWTFAADRAGSFPESADALTDSLRSGLGSDGDSWRAFLALAGTFPGTLGELITTAAAVTATPTDTTPETTPPA